jgi:hypothetical protein
MGTPSVNSIKPGYSEEADFPTNPGLRLIEIPQTFVSGFPKRE